MKVKTSNDVLINSFPTEIDSIHISYPPGSLEEDWRDEALRHRETLDKIKKIIDNEKVSGIEAKLMIKDILEEKK